MNFRKPHPLKGYGTLVDYNYTSLVLPSVIVGSTIGVIINVITPEVILTILLTLLCAYLFVSTIIKNIRIYKAEN